MNAQDAALLKLLEGEEGDTFRLIHNQLVAGGLAALPRWQALQAVASGRAKARLAEIVATIETENIEATFGELCATFREHGDLEDAAWKLAATFLPGEDFTEARSQLNAWGAEVARRLVKATTEEDRIETLVEYLAHEVRLRGNEDDYYNLNNSLLPEVIETRRGIPITLSLLYMLVGKRAGVQVQGVGLPGHFIIRSGEAFFDPFHGGQRVGLAQCQALLEQRNFHLTPDQLRPATPRQILSRMLANIHRLAVESDPPLAAKVGRWLEALQSTSDSGSH